MARKAQVRSALDFAAAAVLKGGDTGPAAVAGKPAESLLIQAVRHEGDLKMPPNGKLTQAEMNKLTRWVRLGLPWPEPRPDQSNPAVPPGQEYQISAEQRHFWSFQPVKVTAAPPVRDNAWCRSALDRYTLAALEARDLRPAQPADKLTLLRRATFDLTGLPPAPAEVAAFLADQSPDAFARVVDRLLLVRITANAGGGTGWTSFATPIRMMHALSTAPGASWT